MAIYIATTKSISRSNGQSAVASASYRAGVKLYDERHGKTQNYSNRDGVMSKDIILPTELKDKAEISRNELWNMAEQAENRKDSRVAREWIVNLPHELDEQTRKELAHTFAQSLADKYGVIADCCIHQPTQKEIDRGADARNFHAHIMLTTRQAELTKDNKIKLGDKATIELSDSKRRSLGLDRVSNEITEIRELWERTANEKLLEHGHNLIDSRSYQSQGIDQLPQLKMGKAVTQMERDGVATDIGNINRMIAERNELVFAKELEEIQKTNDLADQIIINSREANTANKEQTATPKNEFVERLKGTNAPAEAEQKTAPPPQEQTAEQVAPMAQKPAIDTPVTPVKNKKWLDEAIAEFKAKKLAEQKTTAEAVTTPPPPPTEQKEQKQGFDFKAIRRSQIEKRQAELKQQIDQTKQLKGLATNHDTIKQQPPEIQQEIKQEALKRLSEIEHRATNKCLMSDDIEAYQKAKGILNSVERLEEQRQAQEQNKKQSELTAVSEPKQSHAQNATQKPIEQRKIERARVVPTHPEKSHHSENRQQNEPLPPSIDIKKAEQTFSDYLKKVEEVAKTILNNQLKALREKAKPLLEKFENLRDNKPKSEYVRPEFMGKSKWAIEKDEAQTAYSNIKITHDSLKEKGVTDDHRAQAKQQIAINVPELHRQAQQAQEDIEAHRAEQKKAQEATAQYIDPDFAKIKAMDKEQRQRMKENFEKGLNVSPATLKNFSKEQLDTLKSMQTEGRKFLQALQSVETHERLSEQLERMQQDREQGRSNNIDRQFD